LNRIGFSHVINKPEADHQFVYSAKYLAALRKMSRSSRSSAFSFFSCRICSASDKTVVSLALVEACAPYLLIQFFRVIRLTPRSLAICWSEAPSEFSYKATASRLNSSEQVLIAMIGRLPFCPKLLGY